MRFPSLKTLQAAFGLEKGKAIRLSYESLLEQTRSGFPQATMLRWANEILGTHGVEFINRGRNSNSPSIEYCNTGETYNVTLLLLDGERFHVGSWGDIVERGNYD